MITIGEMRTQDFMHCSTQKSSDMNANQELHGVKLEGAELYQYLHFLSGLVLNFHSKLMCSLF